MESWQEWIKGKKVVFFVAETVPSVAGFGLNAFNFASALYLKGCNTTIICYNYNNKLISSEVIENVNIRRIAYYNRNILTKIFSFPWLVFNYYKQVKGNNIVFVYGKYLVGYELILFLSIISKKKTIFRSTLLGDDDIESIRKQSRVLWILRKYLISKISCYFAINNDFATIWKNFFPKSPMVFKSYQGVNTSKFNLNRSTHENIRDKYNIPQNTLIFFSCGELLERKGYRDIFKTLAGLDYPFFYIIAGQYNENDYHRFNAKELQEMKFLYSYGKELLGNRLTFIGITNIIEYYYRSSDFLIHGAYSEGTPNTILEAMASGLPIICRKLIGISGELLRHNENYIEFKTIEDLTEILNKIHSQKAKMTKFSLRARKKVEECYNFETIAEKLFVKLNV